MSTHAPASPAEQQSSVTAPSSGQEVTLHAAFAGIRRVPQPVNEPNKTYAPGSPEKAALKARLKAMAAEKMDRPLVIAGLETPTVKHEQWAPPADPPPSRGQQQCTSAYPHDS